MPGAGEAGGTWRHHQHLLAAGRGGAQAASHGPAPRRRGNARWRGWGRIIHLGRLQALRRGDSRPAMDGGQGFLRSGLPGRLKATGLRQTESQAWMFSRQPGGHGCKVVAGPAARRAARYGPGPTVPVFWERSGCGVRIKLFAHRLLSSFCVTAPARRMHLDTVLPGTGRWPEREVKRQKLEAGPMMGRFCTTWRIRDQ